MGLVLKALEENGLKVNPKKSEFGMDTLDYLGFSINKEGVKPKKQQVDAILRMPKPKDITSLRSFTGSVTIFGG